MSDDAPALEASGLTRRFVDGERELVVLRSVGFALPRGGNCAIVGPSGSGKSTLLGLLAGLDAPDAGSVRVAGQDLAALSPGALAAFRGARIGFVFQSYQLFPHATALENVRTPLELTRRDWPLSRIDAAARERLAALGLGERLHHRPAQLSGGEQQRVAIARAMVTDPDLILADEPTGNLDPRTGEQIESLLLDLHQHSGAAVVLVTHDRAFAERADRVIELAAGELVADRAGHAAHGT